jgi:hypothetical protein
MEQSRTEAELDALNIRYESELQAKGLLNQASLSRFEGKQARKASYWQAGTSLLNSAASYAKGGMPGLG